MIKQKYQPGLAPIVMLLVGLFIVGGAVAVVSYVQSNQPELEDAVEESQQQYQDQLTQDYPDLYLQAGLPPYPNGDLTKKREGRDLSDGVQVTLETADDMATIKSFFDQELADLGFSLPTASLGNDFAYFGIYTQGDKKLSLQITKIEDTSNNQIYLNYSE